MDFTHLNDELLPAVMKALKLINNPEVEPEVRQLNQEILLREVGQAIYDRAYDMAAFDFEIEHTTGAGIDDRHFGLAKVAAGSVATGTLGLGLLVRNYMNRMATAAQEEALQNARQSGRQTRMVRALVGDTCAWCISLVGVYNNPGPEAFLRHRGCDCTITTEGFRSRNGLLQNYVKPQDR